MESAIVKIIEKNNLDKNKSEYLLSQFNIYQSIANEWAEKAKQIIVNDESQVQDMKLADEARKEIKQKRVDIEKLRKQLKESSLREGQTIDAIAKALTGLLTPIEEDLTLKANFKAIKQAERNSIIYNNRIAILRPYGDATYDQSFIVNMDEDAFSNFIAGVKFNFEEKLRIAKEQEEERLRKETEEKEERERIRIEHDRLRNEADRLRNEAEVLKTAALAERTQNEKLKEETEKLKQVLENKFKNPATLSPPAGMTGGMLSSDISALDDNRFISDYLWTDEKVFKFINMFVGILSKPHFELCKEQFFNKK